MSEQRDGARNALSGFLFQAIVDIGLTVRALNLAGASDADKELTAILSVIKVGQINEELFGQDAVMRTSFDFTNSSCLLVQYKYSRQVNPPPIGQAELLEIADKLYSSGQESTKAGYTPSSFVLLTNRPLGPTASTIVDAAKRKVPNKNLRKRGRQEVIGQLKIPLPDAMAVSRWFREIEQLGVRYGASSQEIGDWLNHLFGRFAAGIAAGAGPEINKQVLLEALLGAGESRPLTPVGIVDKSKTAISETYHQWGIDQPFLRREIIQEITTASSEHALVIVFGEGGNGKTVTLLEWAHSCVSSTPPDEQAFTGFAHATEVDNCQGSRHREHF